MPRISAFYGILIYMYFRDHAPPHFHAIYGEHEAVVDIASGEITAGALPRRATGLVEQWRALHRDELMENWRLSQLGQPLQNIVPLD